MVSESLQFSVGVFSPKLKYKLEKGAFQRFERCVSVFWQSLLSAACLKFQAPCSRKELNIAVDNKANAEGNVFQPWHVYQPCWPVEPNWPLLLIRETFHFDGQISHANSSRPQWLGWCVIQRTHLPVYDLTFQAKSKRSTWIYAENEDVQKPFFCFIYSNAKIILLQVKLLALHTLRVVWAVNNFLQKCSSSLQWRLLCAV